MMERTLKPRLLVIRNWLHTLAGRGLAGIAVMASLAWFLWPSDEWHLDPGALASLVVAFIAWIASISPDTENKPSKHDQALLQRFRDLLSEPEKDFLRSHDFGVSFSWASIEGTQGLAYRWNGSEFEFDDASIQDKFVQVLRNAREFITKLGLGSAPIGTNGFASVIPDIERRTDQLSEQTLSEIEKHNERATTLIDEIDLFIKFARQRLD